MLLVQFQYVQINLSNDPYHPALNLSRKKFIFRVLSIVALSLFLKQITHWLCPSYYKLFQRADRGTSQNMTDVLTILYTGISHFDSQLYSTM